MLQFNHASAYIEFTYSKFEPSAVFEHVTFSEDATSKATALIIIE